MTELHRAWINQPSTLHSLHHLHGTNVLVTPDGPEHYRAYFLSGPVISSRIQRKSVSAGWREEKKG